MKKILIIGSGGREHALGWKLKQSPHADSIYFAPGNGGTQLIGENIKIDLEDLDSLVKFAQSKNIDLTVVGSEVPLAEGIVDRFSEFDLKIFGPSQKAARLESSKAWASKFMRRHSIPCPEFKIFSNYQKAKQFIKSKPWQKIVVKASGLAAGKGVIVCDSPKEALDAIRRIMIDKEFKSAGDEVVIQERITGEEVSLIAFSDGKIAVPLLSAQDHKPIFDGNKGPNTGGMGVYVPVPFVDEAMTQEIVDTVLQPTIDGMRKENCSFRGVLYAGLMFTNRGIKVLEFNCRFGDPETQPQMVLLKSDLYPILLSCIEGKLNKQKVQFHKGAADCVVLASKGYPKAYKKGELIRGLNGKFSNDTYIFHAGTKITNGQIFNNGGRVLGITSRGANLDEAAENAYKVIGKGRVHFKNMYFRTDIGKNIRKKLHGPYRIEVESLIKDARTQIIVKKIKSLGYKKIRSAKIIDVYTLDKNFKPDQLQKISEMLTDPVTQKAYVDRDNPLNNFTWAIEIGFLPGVTDNLAATAKEAIEDLLKTSFKKRENVYSSYVLLLNGNLKKKEIQQIAEILYNPLIQTARINKIQDSHLDSRIETIVPRVRLTTSPSISWINLNVSDQELEIIGKHGILNKDGTRRGPLALDLTYLKAIRKYFNKKGKNPTDIELESIAQTWSEHCKHTIFTDPIDKVKDGIFKTYIKGATERIRKQKGKDDFCISVFKDNSGAIVFDDKWLITDKVETHNSPSLLDPFGGSITGIVGVNRDTIGFGLGAKPIINRYGFCLADPNDKTTLYKGAKFTQRILSAKRIMEGVIEGVNVGGNCSGIPTPQGFVYFDKRYRGKPLVFVGTVGLIPKSVGGNKSFEKKAIPGDLVVMIGGRVGLDGIHGATFSSEAMDSSSPAGAVQIGDPITQKKLSDAVIKEARDLNLYNSITDNGAGGLSCSVSEMAKESGGCLVELDKVPLKYPGLEPWQTWVSESQERMTLAVPPKNWSKFKKVMDRHGVEATIIGTFTDSGKCIGRFNKLVIVDLDLNFLHDGLPARPMQTKKPKMRTVNFNFPKTNNLEKAILDLLSRLNIASFAFISNQYDHEVQGGSVLKPLQGRGRVNADATVIRPLLDSPKGVVVSQGLYPSLSGFNAYHMAACSIDTAIRNVVASGANPDYLALLDNFCWSSSNDPERLWQLKQAAKACFDYATAFKTPFISGKDSMFNDFQGYDSNDNPIKISVPPTLLISSLGVINDIAKTVSLDVKFPEDLVYILGETHDELTGSEYLSLLSEQEQKSLAGINLPRVNAQQNLKLYRALYKCIQNDLVASAISVGRGGLAVSLTKMAIAGMHGLNINLEKVPGSASQNDNILLSESQGRILITTDPSKKTIFEKVTKSIPKALIGKVSNKSRISIKARHGVKLVSLDLQKANTAYHQTFKDY